MQLTVPNVFQNGTGEANIIDAPKMNANFDAIKDILNGQVEDDNIKAGAKVLCSDRNYVGADKITGAMEFSAFPIVPDASVPDGKLSANVPLKNAANVFSALQKFSAGIDGDLQQVKNLVIESVASLPEWVVAYKGRILYNYTDGTWWGGGNSGWKQMDYVGDYTGGAIRVYSDTGIVDDGDSYKFLFKTEGASPTVKIYLKGEPFPKRFYTELAYHTHVFTGIAHNHGVTDGGHSHGVTLGSHGHGTAQFSIATHTHGVSGNSGNPSANHTHAVGGSTGYESAHTHEGVAPGSAETAAGSLHGHAVDLVTGGQSADHTHFISLTSGSASANQAIPATDLGGKDTSSATVGVSIQNYAAGGNNAYAGVGIGSNLSAVQKLYGKGLIVAMDGTDVTAKLLTATGWGAIGDGTGAHALHASGTGELDASAWKAFAAGLHTLEITEPTAGYGCSVSVHIETY